MPVFDAHAYLTSAAFFDATRTREHVLSAMDRFELDAIALVSHVGITCDYAEGNHNLREVVDAEAGIFAYVTLNTEFQDESMQEQRLYLSKREFIGSLLVSGPGQRVSLSRARDIVNAQRRYVKPVALMPQGTDEVVAATAIAEEFNQIKFIWLGMGGDGWRAAIDSAKKCLNVHLEISGNLDAEKIAYAVTSISARRLHFGSALPFGDPSIYKGMVDECDILTTSDRNRIFLDNSLALFQINAEVE
jgi:hypothetical protein